MQILIYILVALVAAVAGTAIHIAVMRASAKGKANAILEKAELEGEKIKQQKILQAKEKFLQLKAAHDESVNKKNQEIRERENGLRQKEQSLKDQLSELGRKQHDLESQKGQVNAQKEKLERKSAECDELLASVNKQLEAIAGMTAQEARNMLVENLKAEARTAAQAYINDTMDEARLNAVKESKRIVINTIQRIAP